MFSLNFDWHRPRRRTVTLGPGFHQIHFPLRRPPRDLWVRVEPEGCPVCVGTYDLAGAVPDDRGFTLYADVKSDRVEVEVLFR